MSNLSNCDWCGRSREYNSSVYDGSGAYCSEKCRQEKKNNQRSQSSGGSSTSGCFIATSVYGDYDHPIVLDLRQFRDNWLDKRNYGRNFITWYYRRGPFIANWIDKSKTRKLFTLSLIIKPLHFFVKLFRLHK